MADMMTEPLVRLYELKEYERGRAHPEAKAKSDRRSLEYSLATLVRGKLSKGHTLGYEEDVPLAVEDFGVFDYEDVTGKVLWRLESERLEQRVLLSALRAIPVEEMRVHPRVFISFGALSFIVFTLFGVVSGLILNRLIIAPDFAIGCLILSLMVWLMVKSAGK